MGMSLQKKCLCGFVLFTLLVGIIGFLIGYYARPGADYGVCSGEENGNGIAAWNSEHEKQALEHISVDHIRRYLQYFTNQSHLAGTEESYAQAQYIEQQWKAFGFDAVETKRYDVLLSYPTRPGMVSLIGNNGIIIQSWVLVEKDLDPTKYAPRDMFPYSAYSASGVVTGKLVYSNYGRESDFRYLDKNNITCSGKIVIIRHGKIFTAQKVENAQRWGAEGVIFYSDPADYDRNGQDNTHLGSLELLNDTVHRSTLWAWNGDSLTPGYPSTGGIYREAANKTALPKIPVQPISFSVAESLLRTLNQTMAPPEWQGGLGFTYRIQMDTSDVRNVSVNVSVALVTRPVYNVIATIKGFLETDRYVLLGNPRDAWAFGAVNPSGGTAVLMEVTRSLWKLQEKGWHPRRTIKICSWGAKQFGVIGSGEWVEEYEKVLGARAVAYINVESAVEGNFVMKAQGSPLLERATFEAAKKVAVPGNSNETLYDEWKRKAPDLAGNNPSVAPAVGASDCLFFAYSIGVPCMELGFRGNNNSAAYPLSHSIHDTFSRLEKFVDPTLEHHKAIAQVWLQLTLNIAGSVLIPFNVVRYAELIDGCSKEIGDIHKHALRERNITLDFLLEASSNFTEAAEEFQSFLGTVDRDDILQVRMANDRLLQLNRAFIDKNGLLSRPCMRHVVLAPSVINTEAVTKFPGITDAIFVAKKSGQQEDWDQVKRQISAGVHAIRSATSVLTPTTW